MYHLSLFIEFLVIAYFLFSSAPYMISIYQTFLLLVGLAYHFHVRGFPQISGGSLIIPSYLYEAPKTFRDGRDLLRDGLCYRIMVASGLLRS